MPAGRGWGVCPGGTCSPAARESQSAATGQNSRGEGEGRRDAAQGRFAGRRPFFSDTFLLWADLRLDSKTVKCPRVGKWSRLTEEVRGMETQEVKGGVPRGALRTLDSLSLRPHTPWGKESKWVGGGRVLSRSICLWYLVGSSHCHLCAPGRRPGLGKGSVG